MSEKSRNEKYKDLLNAIEFYVNDKETQQRDWYEVLTEALEFLKDNYTEVSALRRCCWVMDEGKPSLRECYQYCFIASAEKEAHDERD